MLDSLFWVRKLFQKTQKCVYGILILHRACPQAAVRIYLITEAYILKRAQGLYFVTDMYPFHRQARKVSGISLTMGLSVADRSCSVKRLDNGIYYFAFPFAFRLWIPHRQG